MLELPDGRIVDPRKFLEEGTGLTIRPTDLSAKICRGYALMWINYPSIQENIKRTIGQSIKHLKRERRLARAEEIEREERKCGIINF